MLHLSSTKLKDTMVQGVRCGFQLFPARSRHAKTKMNVHEVRGTAEIRELLCEYFFREDIDEQKEKRSESAKESTMVRVEVETALGFLPN